MNTVQTFRKKPVVVEAMQFTEEAKDQVFNWISCNRMPSWDDDGKPALIIQTLEGNMKAVIGDWIIKEPFPTGDRDFYPCKLDIFEKTYEKSTPLEPVKSLQECQNQIAEIHGLPDWNTVIVAYGYVGKWVEEAAELYASQFKKSTN
jgi:hypothetical protein